MFLSHATGWRRPATFCRCRRSEGMSLLPRYLRQILLRYINKPSETLPISGYPHLPPSGRHQSTCRREVTAPPTCRDQLSPPFPSVRQNTRNISQWLPFYLDKTMSENTSGNVDSVQGKGRGTLCTRSPHFSPRANKNMCQNI